MADTEIGEHDHHVEGAGPPGCPVPLARGHGRCTGAGLTRRRPAAPLRSEFATADAGEAREVIGRTYGARLQAGSGWTGGSAMTLTQLTAGEVSLAELSLSADLTFRVDGRDPVMIATVIDGAVGVDRARTTDRYQPGDVYLANHPRADSLYCHAHGARTQTVILPASLLDDAASAAPGQPGPSWRFVSFSPLPGGARRWRETVRFVDSLLADPEAVATALVVESAARLLAATVLTVFPNTTLAGSDTADQRDARPETVRRAVSFIEASGDQDVTLADIAAAAHVTSRAVQLAFRRHLDTTPMAYLRRVRLSLAHDDLRNAASGEGLTVTTVAFRWGFASPSSFAEQYRTVYGELPSSTLHHRAARWHRGDRH